MRNMQSIKTQTSQILTILLTALFLTACTADNKAPAPTPDINTYSTFLTETRIKYANTDNDRLVINTLAEFAAAQDNYTMVLELDTDEDKQGFEYALYVLTPPSNTNLNKLYLVNYDKSLKGTRVLVASVTGTICGLKHVYVPTRFANSDKFYSPRAQKHAKQAILQVAETTDDCAEGDIYYERISFENYIERTESEDSELLPADDFSRSLITESQANAVLITKLNGLTTEYGYLSVHPEAGVEFSYYSDNEHFSWTSGALTGNVRIKQASEREVFLWNEVGETYVVSVDSLIEVGKTDSDNQIDTPIQKQIDALFESPLFTLPSGGEIVSNDFIRLRNFSIVHDNMLYYFDRKNNPPNPFTLLIGSRLSDNNQTIIKHDLTLEEDVILVKELDSGKQVLSAVNTITGIETSLLGSAEADEFEIIMRREELFINTLNLGGDVGWQAHKLTKNVNNFEVKTYEGENRLIALIDPRNTENLLILLGYNTNPEDHPFFPETFSNYLFAFDDTEDNGRLRVRETVNNITTEVDFSFGWVPLITPLSVAEARVINDEFSRIGFYHSVDNNFALNTFIFDTEPESGALRFEKQTLKLVDNVDVNFD